MNINNALALLNTGQIFTVTFTKRSTGEVRVMNARRGVKKHLKGGSLGYNATEKGLIPVYDMQKKAYRSIAAESITEIKIGKDVIKITS